MKQSIEAIANVLLQKRIAFTYEPTYLKITDSDVIESLFETATYHNRTKKLVLMNRLFQEVPFENAENALRYFHLSE